MLQLISTNKELKQDPKFYKVRFFIRNPNSENTIKMKILEVNKDQRCIEFTNVKGSLISFHEHLKDFRDKVLVDYINVVTPGLNTD